MSVNNLTPLGVLESILKNSGLTPHEKIKRLLGLRGESQEALARALDRHPVHLNQVLMGRRPSLDLQRRIAEYLGVAYGDLWGHDPTVSLNNHADHEKAPGEVA